MPATTPIHVTPIHVTPIQVTPIPAFNDNYIWLLRSGSEAVVVDPGDAEVVTEQLQQLGIALTAIWITHHHPDHVGGVERLLERWPVPVFGPAGSPAEQLFSVHLTAGQQLQLGTARFDVLAIPGHTLDHIAFYCAESAMLFCGDTLFAGGCGRVFEGTFEQMYQSLQQLAALPANTAIYCAHEYTLANLAFASAVEPDNVDLQQRLQRDQQLRQHGQPTLPSTLASELATNPFLRCETATEAMTRALLEAGFGDSTALNGAARFAALRRWKDSF